MIFINLLSAKLTKWSSTLNSSATADKLSVFVHFVGLALKGLNSKCNCLNEINGFNPFSFKK